MHTTPQVSVLLLAQNEEATIARVVHEAQEAIAACGVSFEILVMDGGSSDNTWTQAKQAGAKVFLQKRIGYGGALREGFLNCQGEYIITFDADGSHSPTDIQQLWMAREKADIIVASRFVPGGKTQAPRHRKLLSGFLNAVFTRVLDVPVRDISSGYRLYRRQILTPDRYHSEDFNILPEVLIRAYADGYSVAEVPLHYHPREAGASKVSLLKFARSYIETLYEMWVLRNSVDSADYDHRAYDSIIPLQRYWQRKRYAHVTGFLDVRLPTLDIGCGSSRIIQHMPNSVAFDLALRKLRFLKQTNPLRVQGSTFALPFPDSSFAQAVHSQVLEHIPFDPVIFHELNRVLKPGGILVVGTPDYGRVWWPIIEYFYGKILPNAYADEHITHYTKPLLVDILAEFNFRTLAYRYICGGELIVKAEKVGEVTSQQRQDYLGRLPKALSPLAFTTCQ